MDVTHKKLLVAVSGGVDSVVLLDRLARSGRYDLVVAHFDHGIRPDSADDAQFVGALARSYSLPFVVKREELHPDASEELARTRRYAFLRDQAQRHNAVIVTAHHADDVVETIAINVLRGTGWRGLAVLGAADVVRPQLNVAKSEILAYAVEHRLEWVEDATNSTDAYLRNRIRRKISQHLTQVDKMKLLDLWQSQRTLRQQIDSTLSDYRHADGEYRRYDVIMADWPVACELVRSAVYTRTGNGLMRPQLERAVLAIRTAASGAVHHAGSGVQLQFSQQSFIVQTP